jgi:N,N'-diacetyllegionaminate synthase
MVKTQLLSVAHSLLQEEKSVYCILMRKEIMIRDRKISEAEPVFIMAECGVTCNYDMENTKRLIDTVADSGADAIKFIFWFVEEIMSERESVYEYETTEGRKSENLFDMLNDLRFSFEEWQEIKTYADQKGIIMFSSINCPSGIDWTEDLELDAYKLSSWDHNYISLWKKAAAMGKPMLIDTGPVNTLEVARVMQTMKDANNDQSVLVHCFHTDDPKEMNMNSIPYMRSAFDSLVGYSSANREDWTDIMSVVLGSCVLEKRLTMDRSLPGHHHVISKEPDEFKAYVEMIRGVQNAMGAFDLLPSPGDLRERKRFFRHLVANKNLTKGTVLTGEMLEGKRPEEGISPEHVDFFIGRELKRDIKENDAFTWQDI